ncbi:MAG: ATP-binding cassette domain-containing protein [Candidatus Thiodiazotropha sp.]
MALLECNSFELEYSGRSLSIPNLSLDSGDIGLVFGHSDSHVSDFLLTLGGLINAQTITNPAEEGTLRRSVVQLPKHQLEKILLDGVSIYALDPATKAQKVGFVFDNPELGIFGRNVEEDYLHSLSAAGLEPSKDHTGSHLFRYGLGDRLGRQTSHLSGGEMQRLNCACALDRHPLLLVADFSYSNLDNDFLFDFITWTKKHCETHGAVAILAGIDHQQIRYDKMRYFVVDSGAVMRSASAPSWYLGADEQRKGLSDLLESRSKSDSTVLSVSNLARFSKKLNRRVTIPASFEINQGEIHLLTGANGSGKSTVAQFIVGRSLKHNSTGEFKLGDNVTPVLAPQFPERSFIGATVAQEIPDQQLRRSAGFTEEHDNIDPLQLDRNGRKLLAIASAIGYSQGLVILDEPTCGMDFSGKQKFVELINNHSTLAFLIITHDPALLGLGKITVLEESQ